MDPDVHLRIYAAAVVPAAATQALHRLAVAVGAEVAVVGAEVVVAAEVVAAAVTVVAPVVKVHDQRFQDQTSENESLKLRKAES